MSLIPPKIIDAVWRMIPGPLRRRLRSQGGRRLIRFAPAAVLALCATQLTYFILQLANVTAGIAGATGWFAGATIVLALTSKLATEQARDLGLHGLGKVLFAQGLYLAANCVTFVIRFMIFHYVLFNDRGPKPEASGPRPSPHSGPAAGSGPAPFAMTPSANGSAPGDDRASRSGRSAGPRTRR